MAKFYLSTGRAGDGGVGAPFGLPPTVAALIAYLDLLGATPIPWAVSVVGLPPTVAAVDAYHRPPGGGGSHQLAEGPPAGSSAARSRNRRDPGSAGDQRDRHGQHSDATLPTSSHNPPRRGEKTEFSPAGGSHYGKAHPSDPACASAFGIPQGRPRRRSDIAGTALERGGHLHLGLEFYGGDRQPTNVELVEEAVAVEAAGRPLASCTEAARQLTRPSPGSTDITQQSRRCRMAMARLESHVREELLAASDEVIEDAVLHADLWCCAGCCISSPVTRRWRERASNDRRPRRPRRQAMTTTPLLRRKAVEFLKAYRDRGAGEISIGAEDRLPTSLRLASNFELADEDMGLYIEELSLDPWARGLEWKTPPPQDRLEAFNVIVIGGGLGRPQRGDPAEARRHPVHRHREERRSSAARGARTGIPGVGSTPQSRSYTNLFGVDYSYPYSYCPASETRALLPLDRRHVRRCATTSSSRPKCVSLAWDEDTSEWHVTIDGPDGERVLRANARHHRGRLPQPSEAARHRGDVRLPGTVLPLGAVAERPRNQRQALRRHRHRGERLPGDPRARARGRARGRSSSARRSGSCRPRATARPTRRR